MDISSLLGGGGPEQDLNQDLASMTASGAKIFDRPFGDKTTFLLSNGNEVVVTFLFDPMEPYSSKMRVASISGDYISELKGELTEFLLDKKDIAPKVPTLAEKTWMTVKATLPQQTLAKHIFSDPKQLESFLKVVKDQVNFSHIEEEALYKNMTQKPFSFGFKVAIDALPQEKAQGFHKKVVTSDERYGVLTIYMEGSMKSDPEAKDDTLQVPEIDDEEESDKKGKKGSLKGRKRSNSKNVRDQEDFQKLRAKLGVASTEKRCTVSADKKFPDTTNEFFDSVSQWFKTAISVRQQQLESSETETMPQYQ